MAEQPKDYHRIWNDTVDENGFGEPDPIAHSPDALMVLMTQGQDAYLQWVADHGGTVPGITD